MIIQRSKLLPKNYSQEAHLMTRPKNQNLHLLTSQIVIIEAEFIRREKLKKIQLMGNLLFFLRDQLDLYPPFFVDKNSFDEMGFGNYTLFL